jgi:hypothetical protein
MMATLDSNTIIKFFQRRLVREAGRDSDSFISMDSCPDAIPYYYDR